MRARMSIRWSLIAVLVAALAPAAAMADPRGPGTSSGWDKS